MGFHPSSHIWHINSREIHFRVTATEMPVIGYIRVTTRYTERAQRKALEALDIADIRVEGQEGVTIDGLIDRLRRGHVLAVASPHLLGKSRRDLRPRFDAIHEKQAVLFDVTTGRRSDRGKEFGDMAMDAYELLAADRRTHKHEAAVKYGKKGGEAKGLKAQARRTDEATAKRAWKDTDRYPTYATALRTPFMDGWSQPTAWRKLGPRGTKATGRPRKVT